MGYEERWRGGGRGDACMHEGKMGVGGGMSGGMHAYGYVYEGR